MNDNETMSPDQAGGAGNSRTSESAGAWGSRPVIVSDTDITAVPDGGSNTEPALGSPGSVANSAPTMASVSATSLFGQYELLDEVARGGMGVVYRARQRGLDRLVALKMVLGFSSDHDASLQRFILEARSAASLDHPNVVPIYDSGEIDGKMYFTMALVEGPNLKGYVETHGVPSTPHAISLFAQIVGGVAHAHAAGIIHRDLKPANVLMDKDGRPRVTDFGLAKRSSGNSELTGTGQVMGTPAYMPPEQARDSKEVGPPADVYSLGAILYFLLTGRPPFVGESVPDLLIKVVSEDPVPPGQINMQVPTELEAVCLRCLEKSPKDRYADARELAEALLPIVDAYVPRSTHSLSSIPGRSSAMIGNSVPSTPGIAGLSSTVANVSGIGAPPAKKRVPLIALACTAGLLAAVAIYLVISPPKKIVDVKDPGAVAANSGSTQETGTKPNGQNTAAVPAADPNLEALTWPTLAANEFGLKTELLASGPKDPNGVIQIPNKSPLQFKLTTEKDCWAAVFLVDPSGQIIQLFPNRFERDGKIVAGQGRLIPGNSTYVLEATPTIGDGSEVLRVVASTAPMPPLPAGEEAGAYQQFTSAAQRQKVVSHVRGVVVRKTSKAGEGPAPQVAEAELRFRVNP